MKGANIIEAVSKDAWIYFALITTSYLLTVVMYFSARVGLSVPVSEFDVC